MYRLSGGNQAFAHRTLSVDMPLASIRGSRQLMGLMTGPMETIFILATVCVSFLIEALKALGITVFKDTFPYFCFAKAASIHPQTRQPIHCPILMQIMRKCFIAAHRATSQASLIIYIGVNASIPVVTGLIFAIGPSGRMGRTKAYISIRIFR